MNNKAILIYYCYCNNVKNFKSGKRIIFFICEIKISVKNALFMKYVL